MTPSEKAIINTICYFDVFDYPLTLMEIWKWRLVGDGLRTTDYGLQQVGLSEISKVMNESEFLKQRIGSKNGFYFLRSREEIVRVRQERYCLAERKFHRAKRVIKWLRHVPFVRLIAVCNTLAYNNSREQADIDLFIVTVPGRVWQTRFWVAGLLQLFHMRPTKTKTQDKICSTFFTDAEHLNLEKYAVNDDIYLKYWIRQLVPVYDHGLYDKFLESNSWVARSLPRVLPIKPPSRRTVGRSGWGKKVLELIAVFSPEKVFKNFQMKVMPRNLKELANQDSRVVVQDYMLKFHENDRRQIFLERWKERMEQMA